jgi:hypothetical protein
MVGRQPKGNIKMYASGGGEGWGGDGSVDPWKFPSVASLGEQLDPQKHRIRIILC